MDAKVMQYMITRAALLLRAYPTTLQQDQLIIKESTVSSKKVILKRNCERSCIFGLFKGTIAPV
jgi:hypothetical protein